MVDWHLGAGGAWVFRSAEHGGGSAVDLLAVANSRNNFVIGFAGLFETIFSGLKGEKLGRGGRKEGLTVCSDGAVPLLFEAWIMTYLLSPFCIRAAAVFLYCALTESFTTGPIVGERSLLVVAASRFHAITSADCSAATCCWISISQRCCLSFASWHWASRISVSSSSVGWDCVASGSNISVGRAHCSRIGGVVSVEEWGILGCLFSSIIVPMGHFFGFILIFTFSLRGCGLIP
jgi:hypothetical protein